MFTIIYATRIFFIAAAIVVTIPLQSVFASDHADTPMLKELGRYDAMIGDFYVFTNDEQLVLIMTIAAALDEDPLSFRFPSDVNYRFHIDRGAVVHFEQRDQGLPKPIFGRPEDIAPDVTFAIRFADDGRSSFLHIKGLAQGKENRLSVYSGVRDDPFIRSVVIGKNVAAIAVSLPLSEVIDEDSPATILAWATTDVDGIKGNQDELMGHPYYSQLEQYHALNTTPPARHLADYGFQPDVLVFDTSKPAAYPNGRALVDDVVDILGRTGSPPFPSKNDVPFLEEFPFIAPPHIPVRPTKPEVTYGKSGA